MRYCDQYLLSLAELIGAAPEAVVFTFESARPGNFGSRLTEPRDTSFGRLARLNRSEFGRTTTTPVLLSCRQKQNPNERTCEFNFEVQQIQPLRMNDFQRLWHFRFDAKPITTVAWDLCRIGSARPVATSSVLHLLVEFATPNHALDSAAKRMGTNRAALIKFLVQTFIDHFEARGGTASLPHNWRDVMRSLDGRSFGQQIGNMRQSLPELRVAETQGDQPLSALPKKPVVYPDAAAKRRTSKPRKP